MLICIVGGIIIGTLIGAVGLTGVIPEDIFISSSKLIVKICIGAIALIIDILCFWALIIKPGLDKYIKEKGVKCKARIESLTAIPKPGQLGLDSELQKARFVYRISFKEGTKEITKELPPTCLTNRKELSAVIPTKEGEEIDIRYLEKHRSLCMIDNDILYSAIREERKEARIHFIMIPIITNAILITLIILI